jgi:hypothetical protein
MDWGFAPGGSRDPKDDENGQQQRMRMMFNERREDTKLIDRPGGPKSTPIATVRGFVERMKTSSTVPKPIGNALIGTHADGEGHLFIPMFPKQGGATDFEIVQKTIDQTSKSIKLTAVINGPGDHEVHIKGCNIGTQEKFLKKLKEAFGSTGVTAPKHFHGLRFDEKIGITEYMAYEFLVRSRTQVQDRDDLIDAFKAKKFKFIDGRDVPDGNWHTWVPADITSLGKNPVAQNFKFGGTVGGQTETTLKRQFRVETTKKGAIFWDFDPPAPFPPESQYLSKLRADLKLAPQFKSTDTFPGFHERVGYASVDAFVDGFQWTIEKKGASTLHAVGQRWEYTAVIPILDFTNFLMVNFHPDPGSGFDRSVQIVETDTRFFGAV